MVGQRVPDKMEIDSAVPEVLPAVLPIARDITPVATVSDTHLVRAFGMYSVAYQGSMAAKIRQVDRAFGGKGEESLECPGFFNGIRRLPVH